jgi:hypothetical protein
VIDETSVTWSISWSEPISNSMIGFFPDRIRTGELAYRALAIPVTASVTPGPAVTAATPGRNVTLAHPSAAWAAACSCRKSTMRMPSAEHPS